MPNIINRGAVAGLEVSLIHIAVLKFISLKFELLVKGEKQDVNADKAEESLVHEHCKHGARSSAGMVDGSQRQRNRRASTLNFV